MVGVPTAPDAPVIKIVIQASGRNAYRVPALSSVPNADAIKNRMGCAKRLRRMSYERRS
jgi:hypothetical protein